MKETIETSSDNGKKTSRKTILDGWMWHIHNSHVCIQGNRSSAFRMHCVILFFFVITIVVFVGAPFFFGVCYLVFIIHSIFLTVTLCRCSFFRLQFICLSKKKTKEKTSFFNDDNVIQINWYIPYFCKAKEWMKERVKKMKNEENDNSKCSKKQWKNEWENLSVFHGLEDDGANR